MPKFLFDASYTAEGVKGVQSSGGSARRDLVAKTVEGLGGTLETFYFAFGERDAFVIADLPDNESAVALSMAVGATGSVGIKTTVLVTPEEVDSAAQKSVSYTPPGG